MLAAIRPMSSRLLCVDWVMFALAGNSRRTVTMRRVAWVTYTSPLIYSCQLNREFQQHIFYWGHAGSRTHQATSALGLKSCETFTINSTCLWIKSPGHDMRVQWRSLSQVDKSQMAAWLIPRNGMQSFFKYLTRDGNESDSFETMSIHFSLSCVGHHEHWTKYLTHDKEKWILKYLTSFGKWVLQKHNLMENAYRLLSFHFERLPCAK